MKYFGIDLGDGETAVAMVTGDGAVVPQILTLGNTKSILSLVGTDQSDNIVVGENVLLDFQMKTRNSRFKSRFLRDEKASEHIRQFAKGVLELVQGELAKERYENVRIALGCPAGWAVPDRQRYAALITQAGFPNVYTVSESRAAFMYANHSSDLKLSAQQLSRPALVIDIGSSTTDFAHIVNGRETNVGVFGSNALGGGLIDHYLLEDALENSPDRDQLTRIFAEYPVWRSYCELDARRVKEDYFTALNDGESSPCISRSSNVYLDINNPLLINFQLDKSVVKRVLERKIPELNGRCFMEELAEALKQAQVNTADYPPELVILTGGASRMGFFRDACKEAFPNAQHIPCPQPEYSIAYGLSVAARTDHALTLFREEISKLFDNHDFFRMEIIRNLPILQTELTPVLLKGIKRALKDTLNHDGFMNRQQLATLFEKHGVERLQESDILEETNRVISHWAVENLSKVQDAINLNCDKYYVDRMDMSLAKMEINYPVKNLKLPLGTLLLSLLNKIPLIKKITPALSFFLESTMEKQVSQSLLEPNGTIAKQLISSLDAELRRIINERIANIELLIH